MRGMNGHGWHSRKSSSYGGGIIERERHRERKSQVAERLGNRASDLKVASSIPGHAK